MTEVENSSAVSDPPAVLLTGAVDPASDESRIRELNWRAEDVNKRLKQTARERVLLSAEQWIAIRAFGGPAGARISDAADSRGIKNKTKLEYFDAVEVVEGGTPYGKLVSKTPAQKKVRKDRYNHISRIARLFAAMDKLLANSPFKDDPAQVADWIEQQGSVDGVLKAANDEAGEETPEAIEDDGAILAALSGRQAFELPAPEALIAAQPMAAVLMRVDEKLRLVPLRAVSPDTLRLLGRYVPSAEDNLPADLNFLGRLFALSGLFPPTASSEDRRPVDGGAGEGLKLPSFPMIFWDGQRFSLAPSRRRASIVVHGKPRVPLKILGATRQEPLHFATADLKRAQEELAPVEARRSFQREAPGTSVHVVSRDGATHLELTGTSGKLKLRLLPLAKFGSSAITSQYTIRVSAQYEPKADVELPLTAADDLRRFAARVGGSKHVIKAAHKAGSFSLQLGGAEPMQLKGNGKGNASISVRPDDFAAAVKGILDLAGIEQLSVKSDPKGLLEIAARTDAGDFSVFVPATLADEAGNPRDPSLLERLERPRN